MVLRSLKQNHKLIQGVWSYIMNKTKIGILMGGLSSEREISLNTGTEIFNYINKDKYDIVCIEWKHDNSWVEYDVNSIDTVKYTHENILFFFQNVKIDLIFIALHGKNGEDGRIQGFLESIGMPYTGSSILSSSIGMDKNISKQLFVHNDINTPRYFAINKYDSISTDIENINQRILNEIGYPCIVKPNRSGSSVGISKVKDFSDLSNALQESLNEDESILIEENIEGLELSVAVIGDYWGSNKSVLPVIEIVPEHDFFDYECKYDAAKTKEIVPARIDNQLKDTVSNIALKIHNIFMCEGYSRIDFIIKDNSAYALEINTLPGMTSNSLYPKMAREINITYTQLIDQLIDLAFNRSRKDLL